MTDVDDLLEEVREAKRAVADEGRPEAVERQHARGKLTARKRVEYLCEGFDEIGQLAAPAAMPETADWDPEARRRELIERYKDRTDAVRAVEGVGVDAVVEPAETYGWIRRALERYDEPRESEWPPKKRVSNPW